MTNQLRFNPFHQIHQALRALLYHASVTVQHTDFTKEESMQKILLLVDQVVNIFDGHAHTEDELVFPMIAETAPALVEEFEQQHVKDHQLAEDLVNAMNICRISISAEQKIIAGRKLQRALTEFTAFNLVHMNQEETLVLEMIHKHYTDEQILAKEMEIVASLTPEKKILSGYWMLKGLAIHEIVQWYKKMQKALPPAAFNEYIQLAETALPDDKLKTLQEELQQVAA